MSELNSVNVEPCRKLYSQQGLASCVQGLAFLKSLLLINRNLNLLSAICITGFGLLALL